MKKILFLDLEGTVINQLGPESFIGEPPDLLINQEKINAFIQRERPESVGVFSAAIHNDRNIAHFHNTVKRVLESTHDMIVDNELIPTVDDICRCIERRHKLQANTVSQSDFFEFFGKEGGFIEFCRESDKFSGCEMILLDDVVPVLTVECEDRLIRLIPVDRL